MDQIPIDRKVKIGLNYRTALHRNKTLGVFGVEVMRVLGKRNPIIPLNHTVAAKQLV